MTQAIRLFVLLTLLTGLGYPLLVTGLAQLFFPHRANGSLIVQNGLTIGSELIGQAFDAPVYFWGRPSATTPFPYNPDVSTGSNLGPTNPALQESIAQRLARWRTADSTDHSAIPVDLVTASGSGLDPHISPASAAYQVGRVARARGLDETAIHRLVHEYREERALGLFGEPRVNVLLLNLALDRLQ